MAATAKHDVRQKFSSDTTTTTTSSSSGGDEDIAAIAKQISDHAEAIYQTWKSRGLAPTEILNCHSNATAADKFGSALTPNNSNAIDANKSGRSSAATSPTAMDILVQTPNLDNDNLEKLVNNFVVEDKARVAAFRQRSPSKTLPSSVQFALQKFERNSMQQQQQQQTTTATTTTVTTTTTIVGNGATSTGNMAKHNAKSMNSSLVHSSTALSSFPNKPSLIVKPQITGKTPGSHHREVFLETIETTFPADLTPAKTVVQQQQQKKPLVSLATATTNSTSPVNNYTMNSGLTTWPLKNKSSEVGKRTLEITRNLVSGGLSPTSVHHHQQQDLIAKSKEEKRHSLPGGSNANAYMDEVAREEERLMNALKNGSVITEDPAERNVMMTTPLAMKQKPAIKKEKPKVEAVKPIIISGTGVQHHMSINPTPVSATLVNNVTMNNNNNNKNNYNSSTTTTIGITSSNVGSSSSTSLSIGSTTSSSNNSNSGVETVGKSPNKEDVSSMSVVDYAKMRYRAAQQNTRSPHRLEEQKSVNAVPYNTIAEQLVSSARSKFEFESARTCSDKQQQQQAISSVANSNNSNTITTNKEEKDVAMSRWGPRINTPRPRLEQVPHPELTVQQKQHIRAAAATATGNNPVRPFLTRGSVAERVLIFEKCPSELLLDKRGPRQPVIGASWRGAHEVQNKAQTYVKDKVQQKNLPLHTTLQRHVKANRNVHIPRFYFPGGKPVPLSQVEATISRITMAFQNLPGHRACRSQFHLITKACDLPLYWKIPLFLAANKDQSEYVDVNTFLEFWKELSNTHHDAASKFIRITTRGLRNYILTEDLVPLVQDVVETHPGLNFLTEATEFHSRYVHTVIARIFYCVNRSWSGKISVGELRRSNLLSVISILEHEEDINQVTAYFSYEHFYVIYCKFWELDRDHDLFIDKVDLTRHNDHALSTRIIERIFSGAVTRGVTKSGNCMPQSEDKMSYTEFVWFLLSEEDKNHPTAIEYWFRCMDLDGDGYLSMFELEYFYEEQLQRMEALGLETLPFEDCLCQMLDMIHPTIPGKISLRDLKKCKMTSIFFDTFFNLEKYLDHEQRDPFASARDHDADGHELSDWDRFAAEEYELLVAEESSSEQNEQMPYDSTSEDTFSPGFDVLVNESVDVSQGVDPTSKNQQKNVSLQQQRNQQNYDSGDSDDYAADSDN